MLNQRISRWALSVRVLLAVAAFLAFHAGRLVVAQTAVTWQLGRIQFQNKSGYPLHGRGSTISRLTRAAITCASRR